MSRRHFFGVLAGASAVVASGINPLDGNEWGISPVRKLLLSEKWLTEECLRIINSKFNEQWWQAAELMKYSNPPWIGPLQYTIGEIVNMRRPTAFLVKP